MARIGSQQIGDEQLGGGVVRLVNLQSTSTTTATFERFIDVGLSANSNSDVSFTLSEDSYAEQYGRERGNAELDIIVVGNAEVD